MYSKILLNPVLKSWAFIKRGWITFFSYKVAFILEILAWFFNLGWAYFLSRIVEIEVIHEKYQGDAFTFLLLGFVLEGFLWAGTYTFIDVIRSEQTQGTLQMALVTPTRLTHFALLEGLWSFVINLVYVVFLMAMGFIVFGAKMSLSFTQFLSIIFLLFLTTASSIGFGLLSAGLILVIKQGDAISFILRWANTLFCGIYFPMEVLPQGLQYISRIFPLTYGLEGIRLIALNSCGLSHPQVIIDILFMVGFSVVSLPLGLSAFSWGYKKAKRDGSLSFY